LHVVVRDEESVPSRTTKICSGLLVGDPNLVRPIGMIMMRQSDTKHGNLIRLSQSTYLDKILKKFNMDSAKKGFLPMAHGIRLSKTQCPASADEPSRMERISYA